MRRQISVGFDYRFWHWLQCYFSVHSWYIYLADVIVSRFMPPSLLSKVCHSQKYLSSKRFRSSGEGILWSKMNTSRSFSRSWSLWQWVVNSSVLVDSSPHTCVLTHSIPRVSHVNLFTLFAVYGVDYCRCFTDRSFYMSNFAPIFSLMTVLFKLIILQSWQSLHFSAFCICIFDSHFGRDGTRGSSFSVMQRLIFLNVLLSFMSALKML